MPVAWTIEGESGAGWDATARAPEYYGLSGGSVTRGSIAEDGMELSAVLGSWGGGDFALPRRHQRVTLRRDGAVFFRGWALEPRITADDGVRPRVAIQIASPAYWLRRQPVRSARQAAGYVAAANRGQLSLASGQTLAQNLQTLANAFNDTLGTTDQRRIAIGSVATTWAMPILNLSGGDFLSALMELMRNVPDAMAYWNYQSGTHVAQLVVTRRATATTRTVTFPGGCASASFEAMADLEADAGVVVDYAEMIDDQSPNTGRPRYLQQASSGATARAQRLTVSGPEIDSFLPDNRTENATISSSQVDSALIRTKDPTLAGIPGMATYSSLLFNSLSITDAKTGLALSTYIYPLISNTTPQPWWLDLQTPIDWREANVAATMQLFNAGNFDLTYGLSLNQTSSYPWGSYERITGYNASGFAQFTRYALSETGFKFLQIANINQKIVNTHSGTGYQASTAYWGIYSAKFQTTVLNRLLNNFTVYKRPDYQFYAPPANLAANLATAQAFVPWKGQTTIRSASPGATDFRGCIVNVNGIVPAWETMGAMVASQKTDLFSGAETVSCGAPARLSNLNLAVKLRVDPQGNFSYV